MRANEIVRERETDIYDEIERMRKRTRVRESKRVAVFIARTHTADSDKNIRIKMRTKYAGYE